MGPNSVTSVNSEASRYKKELCKSFTERGTCQYDVKCQFAHGICELRTELVSLLWKTDSCRSRLSTAACKYSNRCDFLHPDERFSLIWNHEGNIALSCHRLTDLKIVRIVKFYDPKHDENGVLEVIDDFSKVIPNQDQLAHFFRSKPCVYSENKFVNNLPISDTPWLPCPLLHDDNDGKTVYHRFPTLRFPI